MARFTQMQVSSQFRRFAELMGRSLEQYKDGRDKKGNLIPNAGALILDHNATYGGYVIEEMCEGGGVDNPFGSARRGAQEMWYCLHFAIAAVYADRKAKNRQAKE